MAAKQRIYLLPGFFGFANLGDLVYFGHVRDFLQEELALQGVEAEVHPVLSHPTASIRTRAKDLLAELVKTASDDEGPIHLVGHSTGGLDARLFVTPGVNLGEEGNLPLPEAFVHRVRTVVCVGTPNHGTGLASFFSGMMGGRLLGLLSLFTVYVLRFGKVPLRYGLEVAGTVVRMNGLLGWKETLIEQLFKELLADFSADRREALSLFLSQVSRDQSLAIQLTPEGIDLFNAGVSARPTVRYGSVVTQARRPSVRSRLSVGLDPHGQFSHNLYALLYGRAAAPAPILSPAQLRALGRGFGQLPTATANDGIVPTLSQPHGEVIAAVWADHLDVIGHFDDSRHRPPHVDWLVSATGFRRPQFVEVWRKVTGFLLGG